MPRNELIQLKGETIMGNLGFLAILFGLAFFIFVVLPFMTV